MDEMTLSVLRKDITFIEKGISMTNTYRKQQAEMNMEKANKQFKKLKVFLLKNRNINLRQGPNNIFGLRK